MNPGAWRPTCRIGNAEDGLSELVLFPFQELSDQSLKGWVAPAGECGLIHRAMWSSLRMEDRQIGLGTANIARQNELIILHSISFLPG